MIELEVEPKRKAAAVEPATAANYLVLGDFGGRATEPAGIDVDNFNDVLSRFDVSLAGMRFRELEDFHPDRLFQRLDIFHDTAPAPEEPAPEPASPKADLSEILRSSSLLEQIAEGGDPFQKYLEKLARAHAAPKQAANPERLIALTQRMRGLLHHPRFQALEAAWRGLDLVTRGGDGEPGNARVYIAQWSKDEAARDVLDASDLRSTRIYQLLHGRPWRAVAGLYSFGDDPVDIEFLGRLALIAAHARAPFLAEASMDMGPHWDELRSVPESSHLGLALPRFLLRLPYGAKASVIESFAFEEMPAAPVHAHYLWGHPALVCLTLLLQGEEALELRGFPIHTYKDDGEWKMTPCAEVWMTESQAEALMELGLMPLICFRDSDRVRLAGFRAINGKSLFVAS